MGNGVFAYKSDSKKWRSKLILLLFIFFLNTPVFAFEIIEQPFEGNPRLVAFFDNGSRLTYYQKIKGQPALAFQKNRGGQVTFLSHEAFQVLRYKDSPPPKKHRAVFFENEKNLYAVTDTGIFIRVLEDRSRFITKMNWSMKADIVINDVAYALVSGAYNDLQKTSVQYTGETHLIRLSDGKVALVDRQYRAHEQLDSIQVLAGLIGFEDGEHFSVDRFDGEALERPRRFPLLGSISKKKTAKDAANFFQIDFANGNRLLFDINDGGAYFEEKQESDQYLRKQITGKRITWYSPDLSEIKSTNHGVLKESQKVMLLGTDMGVGFVTAQGQFGSLPVDYSRVDKAQNVTKTTFASAELVHNEKHYLLISFKFTDGKGQTFIIREDGVHFCVDFKFHEFGKNALDHQVNDDILEILDSPRRIDLREFEVEATFNSEEMKRFTIPDEHAQQKEVDPIEFVNEKWVDLIEEARQKNTAFPVLDKEMREELLIVLRKSERGSGVILAGPGEGKTEDVMSLAADWAFGKVKEMPRTWRLLNFDPVSTEEGTQFRGSIESYMKALKLSIKALPTFLFVDEMHALRGSGTHSGNKNDIFNTSLKPGLAKGTIRIIGTDTPQEFDNAFGNDEALLRRIARIRKKPLTRERIVKAMMGWIEHYKKPIPQDRGVYQDSLQEALKLADEFMSEGSLLSRVTDLLDETYARSGSLSVENVRHAAIQRHGADLDYFDLGKMEARLNNTKKLMEKFIIGQEEAINIVIELARQKWARTHNQALPGIRIYFVGPPGQGKTELMKVYAMGMRPHKNPEDALKRIMMRDYSSPYADPRTLASEIATIVRQDPFAILGLDEFESANKSCQKVVLDMFDSGVIRDYHLDQNGRSRGVTEVHVKNAEFFLAGNAGSEYLLSLVKPTMIGFDATSAGSKDISHATVSNSDGLLAAIQGEVPKSVIDRMQSVVAFLPSTKEQFAKVLRSHLRQTLNEFNTEGQFFTMPKEEEDKFIQAALTHFRFGHTNRQALSILQNSIRKAVADARFAQKSVEGTGNFIISYVGNTGEGHASCDLVLKVTKQNPQE